MILLLNVNGRGGGRGGVIGQSYIFLICHSVYDWYRPAIYSGLIFLAHVQI